MSDKKRKVPKLRFPGFTDEWEQRTLGELIEDYVEKTTIQNQYPVLTSSQKQGIVFQEEYFADRQVTTNNNVGYYVLPRGYFTFRSRTDNGIFSFNRNDVVDKGIISYFYPVFSIRNGDSDFFLQMLNNSIKKQVDLAAEGTGQRVLSLKKFKAVSAVLPKVDEQKKIGFFLNQLEEEIILHQHKSEELQKLKKGLLQKVFPKNGERVPELRFPGFTDTWEQRKLGDIVERVTRKNQDMVSALPLTISAQYGLIDQNEFFDKRIASKDVSGYYLIYNGEFAYNKSTSNDAPWGAIKRLDRYENGVLSTLYIVFKIKNTTQTSSDFLTTYYDSNVWHKGVQAIAAEGARNHGLLNIAANDFFETELMISQDIEEQQKIGDYFTNLNNLITLHQRKLKHLEDLKKGLLQQMFI